jgi:hypothetical protein
MARLPRTGNSVSALYERTPAFEEMVKSGFVDPHECETTLADVITGLCLAPLSSGDEQMVRNELGVIIGRGLNTRPVIARMVSRFQTCSDVCCQEEWHTPKDRNQSANPRGARSFYRVG